MFQPDIEFIGFIVGILSLILSIYLYCVAIKKKEPCWSARSTNLISGSSRKLENLDIKYRKERVENLTISKFIFWNKGKETIDGPDLLISNHLKIIGKNNTKFLEASIISESSGSNECQLIISSKSDSIEIHFSYLDMNQGFVAQIIHTGLSSDDILVEGDIKGVTSVKKWNDFPKWIKTLSKNMNKKTLNTILDSIFPLSLLLLTCEATLTLLEKKGIITIPISEYLSKEIPIEIAFPLVMILFIIMLILYYMILRNRKIGPKSLEAFNEEFIIRNY